VLGALGVHDEGNTLTGLKAALQALFHYLSINHGELADEIDLCQCISFIMLVPGAIGCTRLALVVVSRL
jgi:hypothetical protein